MRQALFSDPKKPRIVDVLFDNHTRGGLEQNILRTVTEIHRRGHFDIHVVCTADGFLYDAMKSAGIPVYGIPFAFKTPSLLRSLICKPFFRTLDVLAFVRLIRILNQLKPDLVHIRMGRIENALIKLAGYPVMYSYHGYGHLYNLETAPTAVHRLYYRFMRPLCTSLVPFLDGLYVVSRYEQQRLYREKFLPRHFKSDVIHNGIQFEAIQARVAQADRVALRNELGIPQDARVVIFICRLAPDKNALAFLRIARQLLQDPRIQQHQQKTYVLVAGDGKQARVFEEAFANDPALKAYGRFLGFRKDVPELLYASDVSVSTSLQEGFGFRILESLACGVPCVAYAAGGIPEVMDLPVANEWLVPVGDEPRLVDALIRVVQYSYEKRFALSPVLKAHARQFDSSHQVDRIESFYRHVLKSIRSDCHESGHPVRLPSGIPTKSPV